MVLRIAICDDENTICTQIESILSNRTEKMEIEIFYSGESLFQYISNGVYFDLIFLDIELQILNGVEVGKKIRDEMHNENTQIVFISGKDSYAMDLFEIRPLNFLIKPLKEEEIVKIIKKVIELSAKSNHFFEYKIGRTQTKIPLKDILYFESSGKKVKIFTQDEVHEFYGKLSVIEQQLTNKDFIQIHKSYLVNYSHVIKYHYENVQISDNTVLPISQQQRKSVSDILLQRWREDKGNG
ncbi:LytTR family DNA-binding domain-containing protein [Dehalobacterium formicoaceticum]